MDADQGMDNEQKDREEREKEEEVELIQDDKSIEQLEKKLEEKEKELTEIKNRLLRLQADFINYKKRTEKEKEGLVAFGIETLACGLFPILDDFERALESQTDKVGSFYEGISMIYEQLLKLLDKNEIKEIDALHQPFDPNFHNAMSMEESEEYEEGTIIQVYQKGYMLKDKVIRPAAVIVAK